MEADMDQVPYLGVQVTKERVVAPPERFIAVADDALLEYFEGVLKGVDASQLSALLALLEGICQHEYLGLRRRLEADFSVFSAAARGTPLGERKDRKLQRLISNTMVCGEQRFLADFMATLHSSQYRLLGRMEWDAAAAEEFLFTLPVTVNWAALDRHMLQRFWGDRPDMRQHLPDLSDRILIFHRGFELAKMRGRYLMPKVELLLSFYLMKPLCAALVACMQWLGFKAPQIPGFALDQAKPALSFRTVATAAQAAIKWRRAAHGDDADDEAVNQHDAMTLIERMTLSRLFPDGRSVFAKFFQTVELQEACFKDVVVLYRLKVGEDQMAPGEKEVIRDVDPVVLSRNIHIKQFSGIPLSDLEMVMPEKKVFVPPSVFIQLVVAAVVALVGLVATLLSGQLLDWKVWGSALMLLASRASQVFFQATSERNEIEREMNKLLFERTVASQEAVLHTLTDEMCRQHIREVFLCYCCLLHAGRDMSDDDLDAKCERLLCRHFSLRLGFTAEKAIPPLCRWGLVQRQVDGRLHARKLGEALAALDAVWDSMFSFSCCEACSTEGLGTGRSGGQPNNSASEAGGAVLPRIGSSNGGGLTRLGSSGGGGLARMGSGVAEVWGLGGSPRPASASSVSCRRGSTLGASPGTPAFGAAAPIPEHKELSSASHTSSSKVGYTGDLGQVAGGLVAGAADGADGMAALGSHASNPRLARTKTMMGEPQAQPADAPPWVDDQAMAMGLERTGNGGADMLECTTQPRCTAPEGSSSKEEAVVEEQGLPSSVLIGGLPASPLPLLLRINQLALMPDSSEERASSSSDGGGHNNYVDVDWDPAGVSQLRQTSQSARTSAPLVPALLPRQYSWPPVMAMPHPAVRAHHQPGSASGGPTPGAGHSTTHLHLALAHRHAPVQPGPARAGRPPPAATGKGRNAQSATPVQPVRHEVAAVGGHRRRAVGGHHQQKREAVPGCPTLKQGLLPKGSRCSSPTTVANPKRAPGPRQPGSQVHCNLDGWDDEEDWFLDSRLVGTQQQHEPTQRREEQERSVQGSTCARAGAPAGTSLPAPRRVKMSGSLVQLVRG